MRPEDFNLREPLRVALQNYTQQTRPLPGIASASALDSFLFQLVESIRRIRFVKEIAKRDITPLRLDPSSELFDPIRAAILYKNVGNMEEACWLVFLFTHFGKNRKSGYQLIRDIYGKLGQGGLWDWNAIKADPVGFRHWLDANLDELRSGSVHRAFGNHRKYQSLDPWKPTGTGEAIESYVNWIRSAGSHRALFDSALDSSGGDPEQSFAILYALMRQVVSFGRTAKFDYLSMIGKLELANIRPDSVHFGAATGPVVGAKLLFFGNANADRSIRVLEHAADTLATHLGVDKQVMEDSLCNWQKSPNERISFRG